MNHKFIFICGLHRSGTSLLYKILKKQSNISGFSNTSAIEDEGQHLQSVFNAANKYGGPGKFGFNKDSYLNEKSSLINESNRRRLFKEWSQYWDLSKEYLIEKSPPNLVRTRFLQALFPNSYFITILRHPIATSIATKKWSKSSYSSLLDHWIVCHKKYINDKEKLKNSLEIKYEDLIEDTEKTLQSISEFIGNKRINNKLKIKANINEKYFNEWMSMKKSIFHRFIINRTEKIFEKEINQFNYSFKNI